MTASEAREKAAAGKYGGDGVLEDQSGAGVLVAIRRAVDRGFGGVAVAAAGVSESVAAAMERAGYYVEREYGVRYPEQDGKTIYDAAPRNAGEWLCVRWGKRKAVPS